MNFKKSKIGILGGSFDPAHKGHLAISKEAAKKFKLNQIIWAITKNVVNVKIAHATHVHVLNKILVVAIQKR